MDRQWSLEESLVVDAPQAIVYRLVSDLRNMGRWSPECRSVWVLRPPARTGTRFIGFNRRGLFVWPTFGRVVQAGPNSEFVFDVGIFGLPIAAGGIGSNRRAREHGSPSSGRTCGPTGTGAGPPTSWGRSSPARTRRAGSHSTGPECVPPSNASHGPRLPRCESRAAEKDLRRFPRAVPV